MRQSSFSNFFLLSHPFLSSIISIPVPPRLLSLFLPSPLLLSFCLIILPSLFIQSSASLSPPLLCISPFLGITSIYSVHRSSLVLLRHLLPPISSLYSHHPIQSSPILPPNSSFPLLCCPFFLPLPFHLFNPFLPSSSLLFMTILSIRFLFSSSSNLPHFPLYSSSSLLSSPYLSS